MTCPPLAAMATGVEMRLFYDDPTFWALGT